MLSMQLSIPAAKIQGCRQAETGTLSLGGSHLWVYQGIVQSQKRRSNKGFCPRWPISQGPLGEFVLLPCGNLGK